MIMERYALALDIGGSKITAGIVLESGAILRSHTMGLPSGAGFDGTFAAIRLCAKEY